MLGEFDCVGLDGQTPRARRQYFKENRIFQLLEKKYILILVYSNRLHTNTKLNPGEKERKEMFRSKEVT